MPQAGDILLIRYKIDPLGWIIQWFIGSEWNHSAVVIDEKHIFDCTSAGNKIKTIKHYQNKYLYEIKLLRFITLLPSEKIRLFETMLRLNLLKKAGDFLFLIGLIRVALKKKPIVNTCSGTVAYLFFKLGITIADKPYYLTSPEDLNNIKNAIDVTNELC